MSWRITVGPVYCSMNVVSAKIPRNAVTSLAILAFRLWRVGFSADKNDRSCNTYTNPLQLHSHCKAGPGDGVRMKGVGESEEE